VVTAPKASGTSLRFSEGSRIALDPAARVTVTRSTPTGAELVLAAGRAHVDVVPRPESAWRVHTGPFVVDVTGTRFDLDWDPNADHFSLALYEGKVTISGCTFGAGKKLVAGERAEASCKSSSQSVRPLSAARGTPAANAAPRAETPPAGAAAPTPDPAPRARAAEPVATAHESDWTALARSGRYADAYTLASAAGVANESARRAADDVLLLGETSRLTGHVDDARLAYEAVRRRFAKSAAAAQAAFNLGRLEVRAGQEARAASWFETYLSEEPSGPLAAAALGRLLEARVKLGDTRRARDTARVYLERHPAGPHADSARKVLESER
jgi:TolA-binding protein